MANQKPAAEDAGNKNTQLLKEDEMGRKGVFSKATACLLALALTVGWASMALAAKNEKLRFVFIPKVVHPWYDQVVEGAKAAAREISATTGREVFIDYVAPQQADVMIHNQTIERAIATHPDGLAVAILDAATNGPLLKTAIKHGIPTLVYDSVPPEEGMRITAVGVDYIKQGVQMAEELARAMNYKGQVGLLIGAPTAPNHQLRVKGIKETFSKYKDITIVAEAVDNDSIEVGQKNAAAIISSHPDIGGMISVDAAGPIGIGIAIREAGKKGKIKLVGCANLAEMLKQVEEGIAVGTSVQYTRQIGWWCTHCLYMEATGNGQYLPENINVGMFMLYPDGVAAYRESLKK